VEPNLLLPAITVAWARAATAAHRSGSSPRCPRSCRAMPPFSASSSKQAAHTALPAVQQDEALDVLAHAVPEDSTTLAPSAILDHGPSWAQARRPHHLLRIPQRGRVPLSPAVRWRPEHLTRKTEYRSAQVRVLT